MNLGRDTKKVWNSFHRSPDSHDQKKQAAGDTSVDMISKFYVADICEIFDASSIKTAIVLALVGPANTFPTTTGHFHGRHSVPAATLQCPPLGLS